MTRQRAKAIIKTDRSNTSDLASVLAFIQTVAGPITTATLTDEPSGSGFYGDSQQAEQVLRNLTSRGWLYMGVERDEDGKFVRYSWTMN